MAYIGKSPIIGNFVKLDAITAVNGQAAYTMQNGGANFTDYESVNQFLVSLNGTIQAPTDSFTVSGSTLTFASNLATGDVIDFIMVFGNSLSAGTPTDATVTTAKIVDDAVTAAKINDDIISGTTALTSEPADTDEFLISDAGTLKRIDYSLIKGGGITEADMFRLTADIAQGTNAVISSNLERVDDSNFSKIGTGMSESSGVFTFGATGLYHLIANPLISSYNDNNSYISAELSTDSGSNYTETLFVTNNGIDGTPRMNSSVYQSTFLNVTNATTFRVRFRTSTFSSNTYVYGNTNENYTTFTFIRLGDSQ